MEKVKIKFKPMQNKIVKFRGQKIEVKPFISATDILVATEVCEKEFFKDFSVSEEKYSLFPQVRIAFDAVVLSTCTNIDINGVKYDDIVSSGIVSIVRKEVYNYDEAFDLMVESIRLKNVSISLGLVLNTLPTEEGMEKNIKEMSEMIKQINESNPELLKKAIGIVINKQENEKKVETVSFAEEKKKIEKEKAKKQTKKK